MAREYPDSARLLVKRLTDPGRGRWSFPGGLLELGENIREAAKREVREETGLDTEIDCLVDVEENITCDEDGKIRFHYMLVDFLDHPVGGTLLHNTDAADVRWVCRTKIDKRARYPS